MLCMCQFNLVFVDGKCWSQERPDIQSLTGPHQRDSWIWTESFRVVLRSGRAARVPMSIEWVYEGILLRNSVHDWSYGWTAWFFGFWSALVTAWLNSKHRGVCFPSLDMPKPWGNRCLGIAKFKYPKRRFLSMCALMASVYHVYLLSPGTGKK